VGNAGGCIVVMDRVENGRFCGGILDFPWEFRSRVCFPIFSRLPDGFLRLC